MAEQADAKQLRDLLKQLEDVWKQLKSGDQDAAPIFHQHREVLVRATKSSSRNRSDAAMALARLSYHAPLELWQDVVMRRRIVDLVQAPDNHESLNTSTSVPWQKHGAQILENLTYNEKVAAGFLRPESDDEPDSWQALKGSCTPLRASLERSCSLGAMANLALIASNRAAMWRDPEARNALLLGLNARGVGAKDVRGNASRALAYLAEEALVRNEMASSEECGPFWQLVVTKKIPMTVPDELLQFASATLAKMDGVECTGERTKEEIDKEKRKHAIDLEDEEACASSSDGKRVKREGVARIGSPSSHGGTQDSNTALGAAFNTGLQSNAGISCASASGPSGTSFSSAGASGEASNQRASPTMESIMATLRGNFPSCPGQSALSIIEHVEQELYGETQVGTLKQRALKLLEELS